MPYKGAEIPKPLVSKLGKLDDRFVDSLFENMSDTKRRGEKVSTGTMAYQMKQRIKLLKSTGKIPKVL